MDRIVAWYRVTSSIGAVVALVVANLIPLVGVLFFDWNVWMILVVYWLENGVVGFFNVLKMLRAEGEPGIGSAHEDHHDQAAEQPAIEGNLNRRD